MSTLYEDLKQSLEEAIAIERGEILVDKKSVNNITTYFVSDKEKSNTINLKNTKAKMPLE